MEILHKIKDIWNKVKALVKPYSKKAVEFLKISAKKVGDFCRKLYFKVMSEEIRKKISAFCKVVLEKGRKLLAKVKAYFIMRKEKKKSKPKKKSVGRTIGMVVLSLFLVMVVIASSAVAAVMIVVTRQINEEGEIDLNDISLNYATILFSGTEEEPVEYERIYSAENRTWVDFSEIPEYVRYAFIDLEDQNFENHRGVDWKRTIGAALNEVFSFLPNRQGGSTITQQLIKNVTMDNEVHWTRKVREIVRALNLEKRYSKDEIIEAYLNTISLGNNTAGIKSAANYYFGKEPKELTVAETASIAALTSMPVYYDPYMNPENNAAQRKYVIERMLENGHITAEQYDAALVEEVVFKDKSLNSAVTSEIKSYFTDTVIDEVINDLMTEKGYTYERAEKLVNSGGLQIYTTIDTRIQNIIEQKYLDNKTFTVGSVANLPQSAFIVLDKNGAIKGIVGGRGEKVQNRGLNRATSSKRQPGSSLKPLSVYMPLIDAGKINWSTIIKDSPVVGTYDPDSENNTAYPVNVYKGYLGNMTVCEAVQRSTNTVAMKLCRDYTAQKSFDFLTQKLGLNLVASDNKGGKIYSDINDASMSLGALTNGVTPLEMAAGYLPIMNGGVYTEPHSYTKVYDSKGNLLLDKAPYSEQVVSLNTAVVTNQLLQQTVYGPHGTAGMASIPGVTVAGKTGTTDDYHDRWFIGMTPEYLGAVWIGYDIAKEIDVYRISNPCRIWRTVMTDVMKGVKTEGYPVSKEVIRMSYCVHSGLLKGDNCTETAVGYYDTTKYPGRCNGSCLSVTNPEPPKDESSSGSSDSSETTESSTPAETSKPTESSETAA